MVICNTFFLRVIYFFLESGCMHAQEPTSFGGGRVGQTGRKRITSWLLSEHGAQHGARSHDPEIMTWAKIKSQTLTDLYIWNPGLISHIMENAFKKFTWRRYEPWETMDSGKQSEGFRGGVGDRDRLVMGIKEGMDCMVHRVLYTINESWNFTSKTRDILYGDYQIIIKILF